jgi:hypothetical protein
MSDYENDDEAYDMVHLVNLTKVDRVRSIEMQREAAKKIYEQRTAELDAELARVTRRLEVAEALGGESDPFIGDDVTDHVVLLVQMTFTGNPDKTYTYACLRTAEGRWYTTQVANAQSCRGATWAEFLEWLTKDGRNVVGVMRLRPGKRLV